MLYILRADDPDFLSQVGHAVFGKDFFDHRDYCQIMFGEKNHWGSLSVAKEVVYEIVSNRILSHFDITCVGSYSKKVKELRKYLESAKEFCVPVSVIHVVTDSDGEKYRRSVKFIESNFSDVNHIQVDLSSGIINTGKFEFIDRNFMHVDFSYEDRARFSPWVVGDVHGCANEFREICQKIRRRDPWAVIFQVGDLIDRGPHFYDVFRVAKEYDVKCLLGNHEFAFIEERFFNEVKSKSRMISHQRFNRLNTHKQKEILDFLTQCKNFYYFSESDHGEKCGDILITHAPYQNSYSFIGMSQANRVYSRFSKEIDYDVIPEGVINVHGHQSWSYVPIEDQISLGSRIINVDSGCVYGKCLTAYNPVTGGVERVDADKEYFPLSNYDKSL